MIVVLSAILNHLPHTYECIVNTNSNIGDRDFRTSSFFYIKKFLNLKITSFLIFSPLYRHFIKGRAWLRMSFSSENELSSSNLKVKALYLMIYKTTRLISVLMIFDPWNYLISPHFSELYLLKFFLKIFFFILFSLPPHPSSL